MTANATVLFSYQFEAIGADSLCVDTNTLPADLTFYPTLRSIAGTPTVSGTFLIGLSATNAAGTTTAILTLTIQPAPVAGPLIITGTSATGRTGGFFRFQVRTSGDTPATTLQATGLPDGLTVDPASGLIFGITSFEGTANVTLTATDGAMSNVASLELTFTADPARPVITSATTVFYFPTVFFTYQIEVDTSDSIDPLTYAEIGALPMGLDLGANTGVISGTPAVAVVLQPMPDLGGGIIIVQIYACHGTTCGTQSLTFISEDGAANISTRARVGTGDNVVIGGFIVQTSGTTGQRIGVVVRGLGPSLALQGVPGVLANPYLELHNGIGQPIGNNNDWKDNNQELTIRSTCAMDCLAPKYDVESAIFTPLVAGNYTAILSGGQGVGLVEVYSLGPESVSLSSEAHLANISTRGNVQTGYGVMIGGFINRGTQPILVAVRGIGPSLTPFGVKGALADPFLQVYDASKTLIGENDNWGTNPSHVKLSNICLQPTKPEESAMLLLLPAGQTAYTAVVTGAKQTSGVGLVEVYFGNPCFTDCTTGAPVCTP